jgi:hypothetical protein
MSKLTFVACIAAVLTIFAHNAAAQSADARIVSAAPSIGGSVPRLVQFNGTLKDPAARAVSGVASVTFAIYAEQDGGAALWSETQNVLADTNGHFSALLGTASSGGFPSELIGTGQSRWLGVAIARQLEMPRVLLASVPYALKAGDADTLGGLPASSYVTTQELATSNSRPAATLLSGGGTTVVATSGVATSGVAAGPTAAIAASTDAAQSPVIQTNPTGSGTTNYIPAWSSGSNLSNSILFESGSKLGLGTTTPASTLDINGGEILRGGFYEYPEDTATAANGGRPSHSFQWLASVFNSSTGVPVNYAFGFRAMPVNNNTVRPAASLDLFYGTGGPTGTITDTGLSINSTGVISFAPSQSFNGTNGVLTGLLAINSADNLALNANTTFAGGTALIANGTGYNSTGVQAHGELYGIYALGTGFAGLFSGDVDVKGNLIKSGGSFKIDDPIDPENKYLSHSFVESPDMMNVYNGNVTTDANGFAVVTMPAWFETLNRDFRYQLTAMGQFSQAIVAKEIAGGSFTIQTDKPNVKVSWQITGIRQDAWANAHRIPVEQDKPAIEKGHYIHPELFGHAEDASIVDMHPGADGKLVPFAAKPAQ